MTGCQLHHLQDTLAQVGLDDLNATALQVLVEMAFLREHALALHHLFHLVFLQDIQDDGIIFLSILCPVHMDAILHGILLKLFQIVGQMGDGMLLDLTGSLAQVFPLRKVLGHTVALLAHTIEGLVVMLCYARFLQIGLGSF